MIQPTITKTDVVRQHTILDSIENAIGHLLQALNDADTPGETPQMIEWQTEVVGLIVGSLSTLDPNWQARR